MSRRTFRLRHFLSQRPERSKPIFFQNYYIFTNDKQKSEVTEPALAFFLV